MHSLLIYHFSCINAFGDALVPHIMKQQHSHNFVLAFFRRHDISEGLRKLHCRSLIFVGDMSPFHSEALHMVSKLDRRFSALVEVRKRIHIHFNLWKNVFINKQ